MAQAALWDYFWMCNSGKTLNHSVNDTQKRQQFPNPNQMEHSRAATSQVQETIVLERTKPQRIPADYTSKGFLIYYQVYQSYFCSFWSIKKPFPSVVQRWDWRINVLVSDINLSRRSDIVFPTNHCTENNGSFSVCRLARLCTMSTLSCSFQANQHRGEMSNPCAALPSIRAGMEQPRSLQPPRWTFLISQSQQLNYPAVFLQELSKLSLDELSVFILPLESRGGCSHQTQACGCSRALQGSWCALSAPCTRAAWCFPKLH